MALGSSVCLGMDSESVPVLPLPLVQTAIPDLATSTRVETESFNEKSQAVEPWVGVSWYVAPPSATVSLIASTVTTCAVPSENLISR